MLSVVNLEVRRSRALSCARLLSSARVSVKIMRDVLFVLECKCGDSRSLWHGRHTCFVISGQHLGYSICGFHFSCCTIRGANCYSPVPLLEPLRISVEVGFGRELPIKRLVCGRPLNYSPAPESWTRRGLV